MPTASTVLAPAPGVEERVSVIDVVQLVEVEAETPVAIAPTDAGMDTVLF